MAQLDRVQNTYRTPVIIYPPVRDYEFSYRGNPLIAKASDGYFLEW
jgi:hypothetical protein